MVTESFSLRDCLDSLPLAGDFTFGPTFDNLDEDTLENRRRSDGDCSADTQQFADVIETTSRRHQEHSRSSSAHKGQDLNINTITPIPRYRHSINLIGDKYTHGHVSNPSPSQRSKNRNTNASTPMLPALSQRSSRSIERTGAAAYGIVMYDFKAERSNELGAKAGEAVTVVAQSYPKWFVAKPINRLSSPGLIPVSFVEIRDMVTGTAVANSQATLKLARVPRVEEWMKMAANYENRNITSSQLDGCISNSAILFRASVPTKERLKKLRNGWIDAKSLDSRLLYCQSFNIVLLEQGKLVMKTHDDMVELLENEKLEAFVDQVVKEWPESFGQLNDITDEAGSFQWHPAERHLDDGTLFLCRVAVQNGDRRPLEPLISPGTLNVCQYPTDNMLWQIMPKVYKSVLTMRTIAFLESVFAPTHETSNLPSYGSLNDWFPIQTTMPVLRSTGHFGVGDWFCVQLNLRACIPDEGGHRNKHFKRAWGISPRRVGLPLNRQTAQIPDLSRGSNTTAVEYLLSVAMVLRKKTSASAASALKYDVVTWADYVTDFQTTRHRENIVPVLSRRIDVDLGLKDCGSGGEAIFQFIMMLAKSIDHWKVCWDNMIDKVDDIISVQLQDTLDKKRWNSLMFDDSLQLSEQYFTILQLLRMWPNWIEETERGIKNLGDELIQKCESWKSWQQHQAQNDLSQWPLDMTKLKHNIERLQGFFETRASPLRERIKKKNEEVKSLQDALLSTSSLRETLKAKTLNLYIGVFTTVTVFFTPLGFIATLWTIPFLPSNLNNPTPKGFTESFVAVPVLTYILSGSIILYFWAKSSGRSAITNLHQRLNVEGDLGMVVLWAASLIRIIAAFWARSKIPRIIRKASTCPLSAITRISCFIYDHMRRNRRDPLPV